MLIEIVTIGGAPLDAEALNRPRIRPVYRRDEVGRQYLVRPDLEENDSPADPPKAE